MENTLKMQALMTSLVAAGKMQIRFITKFSNRIGFGPLKMVWIYFRSKMSEVNSMTIVPIRVSTDS